MEKELIYSGYAVNEPDYNCNDGECSALLDLWHEDGAYKPVLLPADVLDLSSVNVLKTDSTEVTLTHLNVCHVHNPKSGTKHYIAYDSTAKMVAWLDESQGATIEGTELITLSSASDFRSVTSIGNTVIVITAQGMYYFLWKGPSEGYKALGNHIPELDLSFGLQGEHFLDDEFAWDFPEVISDLSADLSEQNSEAVTSTMMAKVNKFIADKSVEGGRGRFLMPFLVRYAYRLYDGSLTMQSAPIPMLCSSGDNPIILYYPTSISSNDRWKLCGQAFDLDYCILSSGQKANLQNWKDIVRSVDVFISAPMYPFNQAGYIKKFHYKNTEQLTAKPGRSKSVCKMINSTAPAGLTRYQVFDNNDYLNAIDNIYAPFWEDTNTASPLPAYWTYELVLPEREPGWLEEEMRTCANFYLLSSIAVDNLATTRTVISVGSEYLQSLVNRETLPDDYDSHDALVPRSTFAYNGRLNLANISKYAYNGFHPNSMMPWSDGYKYLARNSQTHELYVHSTLDKLDGLKVFTYLSEDGKDLILSNNTNNLISNYGEGLFGYKSLEAVLSIYHPNIHCKKAKLRFNHYTTEGYEHLDSTEYMEENYAEHPGLNGSNYVSVGFTINGQQGTDPTVSTDRTLLYPNKIYTSEANNPFYFPVTNINTIGVGEIIGISAAAKPLSLGQFGEFPLYAFSTDGVWAMNVNSTGGYSAKQPISMDVCLSTNSITQLDNAVAFSTSRGIMVISGSEIKCISDLLNEKSNGVFNPISSLPHFSDLLDNATERARFPLAGFNTFLPGAKTMYDYVSQRLIVFNPSYGYAYIFSMDGSGQWGIMRSNIVDSINSYPNAMAMATDHKLKDFSVRTAHPSYPDFQLLLTRPIKLDAPDVLKKIVSIIQRGSFTYHPGETYVNPVQTVLYGSRDLKNWFTVWSSQDHYLRGFRGTAYKYYRILLKCRLKDQESITGCTINYEPELTNKPR